MTLENWQKILFLKNPDGTLDTFRFSETFPKLTDEQLAVIRPFAEEMEIPAGFQYCARGERDFDFYVLLSGDAEIFETDSCGTVRSVAVLGERNFTGEITLFSHGKSLTSLRSRIAGRVLRVKRQDFKRMLAADSNLSEIILRAMALRRSVVIRHGVSGVTLIGDSQDSQLLRIRQFLIRNGYPHQVIPPDARKPDGRLILELIHASESDLPLVLISKERRLKNPSLLELATELGMVEELPEAKLFDVAIVGGGPAGLAAAVYAASEGLETVMLEELAPGGQAGTSSRIENYLGFPNGLSGLELASRAGIQALKFGVHFAIPRTVTGIRRISEKGIFELTLSGHLTVATRSVIIASGANYRKLDVPGYERFEGSGIHYAATAMEAQLCLGQEVVVVGGGNSAGQAALYLSQSTAKVHMLVRGKELSFTMSNYLVERIEASPKIQIYYETEITALSGAKYLDQVQWKGADGVGLRSEPIRNVFVMIGATPNTKWLAHCIELDEKGFVLTGRSKSGAPLGSPFETTQPGIFAVGDVRSGSVKRVASAVGEGSVVIQWVHRCLDAQRTKNVPKEAA